MSKKKPPPQQNRWVAVRKGPIYCAPACGAKCTYAAFKRMSEFAVDLAKRLGPGWRPHVWENMGWYCSAISVRGNAKWEVIPHWVVTTREKDDPILYHVQKQNPWYTAYLRSSSSAIGHSSDRKRTPEEAIAEARSVALATAQAYADLLDMHLMEHTELTART